MTNRQKFKEVFGFDLNTDRMDCVSKGSCKDCPLVLSKYIKMVDLSTGEKTYRYQYKYDHCPDFWDDEYVEHDCTNCKHGDTDDTELPCRECGVGPDNKWEPIHKENIDVPASIVEHDIRIRSLEKQIEYLTRCIDNCIKLFQLNNQKIDMHPGFYGFKDPNPDISKRIAPEPMCDIHKDGILGRVGD